MFWKIFILIIMFILIVPIPIKVKFSFNVLRLSGKINITIFKFLNFITGVRFRGQYVYVTTKKGTRRERLSAKNFNVAFVFEALREIYFRIVLSNINLVGEQGYCNNAMVTAFMSGAVEVVGKGVLSKILHNKKSAHIFIYNEAKYNQDCFNIKLDSKIYISIVDLIYSIISAYFKMKGDSYERKQYQEFN